MYLAELHGKLPRENENKEDILTSNVLSFFKYSDRITFLFPLLCDLRLDVFQEDAQEAKFYYWSSFPDGTQPNLLILVGKYYLLFEAKYHSGFGQATDLIEHQLTKQELIREGN